MQHLEKFQPIVEGAIAQLGVDPKTCRTDDPLKWYLHRGRAQVVMFLRQSTTHTDDKRDALVIVAPIIPLPQDEEKQLKLYDYALKMSHKLVSESFSSAEGWLYLSTTYFIGEDREADVAALLDSLSYYAQLFVEELRREYVDAEN